MFLSSRLARAARRAPRVRRRFRRESPGSMPDVASAWRVRPAGTDFSLRDDGARMRIETRELGIELKREGHAAAIQTAAS